MTKTFDPADHTVEEVNDHLEKATATERARVLAAEETGKGRVTVLNGPYGYEEPENESPDQHPFVAAASGFAHDLTAFVDTTREELEALTKAHADATATSLGRSEHRGTAYELDRLGSVLPDIGLALDTAANLAASLAAEAATVEATDA